MSLRNISLVTLMAGFCATALGVGYIAGKSAPTRPDTVAISAATPADAIPTLPTIRVSASAPIPVLPEITVRASVAERIAAAAPTDDAAIVIADIRGGGASLPHVHLDMPYYSFGKVLPRISKE
jgi:hypothetical protein